MLFVLTSVMSQDSLFSKEWCSLIFHNRNQEYGAYQLRSEVGKRYRRALVIVFASVFFCLALPLGVHLYMKYQLVKAMADFQKEIPKLKKKEAEVGHELKAVSTGRAVPKKTTIEGASTSAPDIVEELTKENIIFAEGGDETFIVDEHIMQEFEDRDTLHNRDQKDLPMEGPQIIKVDKVEELPVFPGGMKSLADWMEKNIPYPANLIKAKVQGDMEVSFIVGVDGRVSDVRLTKKLHPQLDKLVLAAFKRMPPWKPGKTDGVPVIVSMTYPLHFTAR